MSPFSIKHDPLDPCLVDGALLIDLQDEVQKNQIVDLVRCGTGLVVIKDMSDHMVVQIMEKQSGLPQHEVSFWVEVYSCITDTIDEGRTIGEQYLIRGS